jgi:hypothetical protein
MVNRQQAWFNPGMAEQLSELNDGHREVWAHCAPGRTAGRHAVTRSSWTLRP